MPHRLPLARVLLLSLFALAPQVQAQPARPAVAELLEDNAEALLKQLTNPGGDAGQGLVENTIVYAGKSSIKIIPMQRYAPVIPGWQYRITANPKPGEYRYLRFAWKADGNAGIMVQLHALDWFIRYTAGVDRFNWGTKFVAMKPPDTWTVTTVDLFKDFGERTITGIALTAFDGQAAYFDHIYFGRTIEDLDRIDATGFRNELVKDLKNDELERLWGELPGADAARAYAALWRLVASPKQAVPFLRGKLLAAQDGDDARHLQKWIRELDDNVFRVREAASKHLALRLASAAPLLEEALRGNPSDEVRGRIERLLAQRKGGDPERERIERAVRVLEYAATTEAGKLLDELAKGAAPARTTQAARLALQRLEMYRP